MRRFHSSVPPPTRISEEALERWLETIRAELRPDPMFRQRLRGHVLNRFVANREGDGRRGSQREMGRLGRAVLYASFALSVSVTGAMAASQQAIPGDHFYLLKLQIESLRQEVAPERLQGAVAAYALAQRIDELDRLADAGNWVAVAAHAEAVETAYESMLRLNPDPGTRTRRLAVSGELLDGLPERARDALERLAHLEPGRAPDLGAGGPRRSGDGDPADRHDPGGGPPAHAPAADGDGGTNPQPTPRAAPDRLPSDTDAPGSPAPAGPEPQRAERTARPDPSPAPRARPSANPPRR